MSTKIKTPRAKSEDKNDADPHGTRYQCERSDLVLGYLTDDELANAVFLQADRRPSFEDLIAGTAIAPIVYLTAAKERIRWLSRQNAKLEKEIEKLGGL